MLKYVLKRLGMSIPILIAVLTLVFIIIRIVPGDPAMVVLGDQASAEALEALRRSKLRLGAGWSAVPTIPRPALCPAADPPQPRLHPRVRLA